ncbi:hypothetical protein BGX26_008690 [Mortierella sp. AD094]|nr:hypothetical protein BGX26_008690 [Mortierella sp. AD094]
MSIYFLEKELSSDDISDTAGTNGFAGINGDDYVFRNLSALEGADLRRLETFLRDKDKDKILGNLYRTTTPQGHVKWVCLEHFRTSYRENDMKSFLQMVDVNQGHYGRQLRKATITLPSSTIAKDFMRKLASHALAVDELDLTLDWGFGSTDLTQIVENLAQTNAKILNLDLKNTGGLGRVNAALPGKGKYHPLFKTLSNQKLQQLTLVGMDYFGSRTSNLSKSFTESTLRSFHFLNVIRSSDHARLVSVISLCTNLVDLRLGASYWSEWSPEIGNAIEKLKRLEVLHLCGLLNPRMGVVRRTLLSGDSDDDSNIKGVVRRILSRDSDEIVGIKGLMSGIVAAGIRLRELVILKMSMDHEEFGEAVCAFERTLEILIINADFCDVGLQNLLEDRTISETSHQSREPTQELELFETRDPRYIPLRLGDLHEQALAEKQDEFLEQLTIHIGDPGPSYSDVKIGGRDYIITSIHASNLRSAGNGMNSGVLDQRRVFNGPLNQMEAEFQKNE